IGVEGTAGIAQLGGEGRQKPQIERPRFEPKLVGMLAPGEAAAQVPAARGRGEERAAKRRPVPIAGRLELAEANGGELRAGGVELDMPRRPQWGGAELGGASQRA